MVDAKEILNELLNKIAAEQALTNPKVKIQSITSGGANFTTQLFQATISDARKELNLFAKVVAAGEKIKELAPMRLFDIETAFYTRLSKIYEDLQQKHNVPREEWFVAPKCYGCNEKPSEEAIVLEDLVKQGFKLYDRLKSVDWDYAARAVEEIAKFHALSVAFEKENKEDFDKFAADLKATWSLENYYRSVITKAIKVVKDENKDRLKAFFDSLESSNLEPMYTPLRLNVLVHADNRASNQMYRRHADGKLEVRLVDYQTIRLAPPVVDLLCFIFTGTDEKFRAQHYERLVDHYYTQLSLAMRRLGLNPDEIYPREDFDYEYKAKLPFGLCLTVITLPLVTIDPEKAPKMDKDMDKTTFSVDKTSDLYPERLNGVVDDYVRWGVI